MTNRPLDLSSTPLSQVEIQPLFRSVYSWMTLGLLITAFFALATITLPPLQSLAANPIVLIAALLGELGLVITLSAAMRRLSTGMAVGLFLLYAALNGFTLSLVLLSFEFGTVVLAFVATAAMFGAMTVVGLTTTMDLTRYHAFVLMGLVGLIVAIVINIFLRSTMMDFLITLAGVAIFTVLTAIDTQKIKRLAADPSLQNGESESLTRIGLLGALTLYLDFINLFLYLLRLLGKRR